jgi:hypothetical protein
LLTRGTVDRRPRVSVKKARRLAKKAAREARRTVR